MTVYESVHYTYTRGKLTLAENEALYHEKRHFAREKGFGFANLKGVTDEVGNRRRHLERQLMHFSSRHLTLR